MRGRDCFKAMSRETRGIEQFIVEALRGTAPSGAITIQSPSQVTPCEEDELVELNSNMPLIDDRYALYCPPILQSLAQWHILFRRKAGSIGHVL